MPVHSSAMSTPRSFHGSFEGSRSAVTLMAPLPTLMVSPLTVTVAREAAVHAVEAQQMRVGFHRAEIVDADDLDVRALGLGDGAQDVAADAAEAIDGNADSH